MKTLLLALFLALPLAVCGQKDVTKFLGIPVDGSKSEMIRKLKEKGFTKVNNPYYDDTVLEGEFNGEKVEISVVTNNNKVYRVFVEDQTPRDEVQIKIRFNRLVRQFENNEKYISFANTESDYIIPDEEDISYEMLVNEKSYEAAFYQSISTDSVSIDRLKDEFLSEYTKEELENATEEIKKEIFFKIFDILTNKSVWFKISQTPLGNYKILMYYDNKRNEANGQDL